MDDSHTHGESGSHPLSVRCGESMCAGGFGGGGARGGQLAVARGGRLAVAASPSALGPAQSSVSKSKSSITCMLLASAALQAACCWNYCCHAASTRRQ